MDKAGSSETENWSRLGSLWEVGVVKLPDRWTKMYENEHNHDRSPKCVPRAAGQVVTSPTGMKNMGHGKGGTCVGWGWNTISHFYVMVAIGSHCKDLAFLQMSWRASASLCHPFYKPCQLSPSNGQSPYRMTLHHLAPTPSLISPNRAPACSLAAILPYLNTSSLTSASEPVSLPFSQYGLLIPRHSLASPFTSFNSLAKYHLLEEISPSHTTL